MPSPTYKQVYNAAGFNAWARTDGACDHLFVWQGPAPTAAALAPTLPDILKVWNTASTSAGVCYRSIYFCQSFDLPNIAALLTNFLTSAEAGSAWNHLAYWKDPVFTGAGLPPVFFPDHTNMPIEISDLTLNLQGAIPATLSDFAIDDDGTGSTLTLQLNLAAFQWSIGNTNGAPSSALLLPLQNDAQSTSGAIGLSVVTPQQLPDDHPVRRTRFVYHAAPDPQNMPPTPGDPAAACKLWYSELTDAVDAPDGHCLVLLDPRDSITDPPWLGNARLNSRVEFQSTTLHTSLFGAAGQRFLLDAQNTGRARLGVIVETIDFYGNLTTNGTVIFHPEGQFAISGPAAPPNPVHLDLNLSPRDMIAGATSTEFFDLSLATHVLFVPQQPAFFLEDADQNPVNPLLDSRAGLAVTSHVQFLSSGNPIQPNYFTQPSEAPLFAPATPPPGQAPSLLPDQAHLLRQRNIFGSMAPPAAAGLLPHPPPCLPIFPRAGYFYAATDPLAGDLHRFESTHLSAYRRNNVVRLPSGASATAGLLPGAAPTKRGVTPQGLLADVAVNGEYLKLYFGNPDTQAPSPGQTITDFFIQLDDPGASQLYQRLQYALAGSQLFMVLRNTVAVDSDAQKVITVGATLHLNDFTFSIGAETTIPPAPGAPNTAFMSASALLVKFYKGKSFADLVQDRRLWVCPDDLAPNLNGDTPDVWAPFKQGDKKPGPTDPLFNLFNVWQDPNWQGVLALDFAIPVMPDLLEALRPGLYAQPNAEPVLRAHHFGLAAVPLRKSDVGPAGAQPNRFCSGFGLVQYTHQEASPPQAPAADDHAPSDTSGKPTATGATYSFIVQQLQIAFDKSQISNFSATVTVGFSHLFWDQINADKSKSAITLLGSYEKQQKPDGTSRDVFSLTTNGSASFGPFPDSFISNALITRAQLSVSDLTPTATGSILNAEILLDVTLTLAELSPIPLFKVNAIRLSNFGFTFTYVRSAAPPTFHFGFKPGGISADIDFGDPGVLQSVLSLLPVTLKGMSIAIDSLIDIQSDLHYTLLSFDNIIPTVHFAFMMEIDFGSLGALAGGLGNFRLPLLFGWRAALPGSPRGIAFGIQFPSLDTSIDFGIQQFVHIHADRLTLNRCPPDPAAALAGMALQLVNPQITMFGEQIPGSDTQMGLLFFIPVASGRKGSWAFGFADGDWYLGGGYRINILTGVADGPKIDTKAVIDAYEQQLIGLTADATQTECQFLTSPNVKGDSENWSVIARFKQDAAFDIGIAISDANPTVYGVNIGISDFDLDLLYQRVNNQLGIFSVELALPIAARTFQFGAATVRLPVFRMELHTDGGYLIDFGFPWNMDYSRSAQVEVYIFVGAGGFYYGNTSASADPRLQFEGGYGFAGLDTNDSAITNPIRDTRVGYASRGGIGRSFSFGILNADASLTLFGSLEGSSAYLNSNVTPPTSLFHPLIFAISGSMGLMLDIQVSVDFSIIQASAHLVAYIDFAIAFRRVLAKKDGVYYRLTLPIVISTDVGLSVELDVRIHIGCINITIHLHFSATWHVQFTLGGLGVETYFKPAPPIAAHLLDAEDLQHAFALAPALTLDVPVLIPTPWDPNFNYWPVPQPLNLYATVLASISDATVTGHTAIAKPAAVGVMLLAVQDTTGGFGDLITLLAAWALLQGKQAPGKSVDTANITITLQDVIAIQNQLSPGPDPFVPHRTDATKRLPPDPKDLWASFPAALMKLIAGQFAPTLNHLPDNTSTGQAADAVPYAIVPLWPGCTFTSTPLAPGAPVTSNKPVDVSEMGVPMPADQAVFAEYCRHMMVEVVLEIRKMLESAAIVPHDPTTTITWPAVCANLYKTLT